MANRRNAQPNQIVSSKLWQYLGIDVVLEERRHKLFEAQAAQPTGDLDRHRSRSPVESSPPTAISPPGAHHGSLSGHRKQPGGHHVNSVNPPALCAERLW